MLLTALCSTALFFAQGQELQTESLRAQVQTRIQSLRHRLDARAVAELSLLVRDLVDRDLEKGALRGVFSVLGPAIELQRQSLESGQGNPDAAHALLASLYESFGVALTHLGEFELAAAAFSFAQEECAAIVDRASALFPPESSVRDVLRQQAFLGIRIAAAWRATGGAQRAWEALEQLRRAHPIENLDEEGRAFFYSQRGNALEDLGRFAEALDDYEKARAGWRSLGESKRELYEWKTSGDALRRAGKPTEALARYEQAIAMTPGVSFGPLELHEGYTDLAQVLLDLGRGEDAIHYIEKAIAYFESFAQSIEGSEPYAMRARSFATVSRALALWSRLRFEIYGKSAGLETLQRVDRFRGMGLLAVSPMSSSAKSGIESIEAQRSTLRRELQILSEGGEKGRTLRRALSRIELASMGARLQSLPLSSSDPKVSIRAELVPEGVLLLEYLVSKEEVFLWAVSRAGCQWFSLAKGDSVAGFLGEIDRSIRQISQTRGEKTDGKASRELLRRLLPPELRELVSAAQTLWIVPDSALHRVPWSCLPWRENTDRPAIGVLPSAAFGFSRRAQAKDDQSTGVDLFVSPRIDVEGLDPLLFSAQEGSAIAALFSPASLRSQTQASEEALKALSGSRGSVLHISAHGIFSQTMIGGSAVLLASSEKDDGWLWASEIQGLSFPDRLISLAACHGGGGEWIPGEGVMGLSQAFLASGARAVIGALWEVDQKATSALMEEFYRRLVAGQSAGNALAQAQQVLAKGMFPAEGHWAGFCLFGDPDWRLPQDALRPGEGKRSSALERSWWAAPWLAPIAIALAFLLYSVFRRQRADS